MSGCLSDTFGRQVRYLRLSVTDRCNFRCHYCRLPSGSDAIDGGRLLSREEIVRLCRLFHELGVERIRLTGGEPLVRPDLLPMARDLAALSDALDLSLSTNAFLLPKLARELKEAGVGRVNISLDSLDPATFAAITGGGELARVLSGIDAALEVGMRPVKLNMVVMGGVNDHEIPAMVQLAREKGTLLRFIEAMPVGEAGGAIMGHYVPAARILESIQSLDQGALLPTDRPKGGGPARYFRVAGLGVDVGVISALSQHFCGDCNRVRLTAEGEMVLCLGREERLDLKTPLRQGVDDETLRCLIAEAVHHKPKGHRFKKEKGAAVGHRMSALGG